MHEAVFRTLTNGQGAFYQAFDDYLAKDKNSLRKKYNLDYTGFKKALKHMVNLDPDYKVSTQDFFRFKQALEYPEELTEYCVDVSDSVILDTPYCSLKWFTYLETMVQDPDYL